MKDRHIRLLLRNLISAVAIILLPAAPSALAEEPKDIPTNTKDFATLLADAEKGNADDQFHLGAVYFSGKTVEKSVPEAIKWWLKAAEQGHIDSQFYLGATYYYGTEAVPKNPDEALKWSKKAAAQGSPGGLGLLGNAYMDGAGVTKDNVKAYAWYSLALAAGETNTTKSMGSLEEHMTQAQIAESQRLAREWLAHIKVPAGGQPIDVTKFQKKTEEPTPNAGSPDVPTLSARTGSSSRQTTKSSVGGVEEEQVSRSLSVAVELRSAKAPSQPYEVQCFFIGRSEATKENFLYDIQRQASSAATDALTFQARDMAGTNIKKYTMSVSGDFSGNTMGGDSVNGTFSGTASSSQKTKGDKFYGWVVRVISKGQVVRMESNQGSLKDLAEKNPAYFDQAAAAMK